jgi:plastocyanin
MRTKALLLMAALALAGCSGGSEPDLYACKSGPTVDLAQVEGSDAEGFDPESACPPPAPPTVTLEAPATMTVHFPAVFGWTVSSGNYSAGHSMSTQLRWSHHTIAADGLAGPESYANPLEEYEHQDIAKASSGGTAFDAKVVFRTPGKYFVRAYAQVRGDGLQDTDFWSEERVVEVGPVAATGKTVTVVHGVGDFQGKLEPASVSLQLGDAFAIQNDDLTEHTFTFENAPTGFKHDPIVVAAGATSPPVLLDTPGGYTLRTDDLQPQVLSVSVAAPT